MASLVIHCRLSWVAETPDDLTPCDACGDLCFIRRWRLIITFADGGEIGREWGPVVCDACFNHGPDPWETTP